MRRAGFRLTGLCLIAGMAGVVCARAQTGTPDEDTLKQMLVQERDRFGLEIKGSGPFHLKAHFDTFDADGKPNGSGTYEAYGDGAERLRTDTEYRGTRRTTWKTPATTYWVGDSFHKSYFMRKILSSSLQPLPPDAAMDSLTFAEKKMKLGALAVDCVITKRKANPASMSGAPPTVPGFVNEDMYCLSVESHSLRLAEIYPGFVVAYNKLTRFGSREIPYLVELSQSRITRAKFQVDTLETWKPDDAVFAPPAGAATEIQSSNVSLSGGVMAGAILSKEQPVYPPEAKMRNISGQVVLAAIISRQGTVDDLEVISSPSEILSGAAMEAVKRWRYKPYLLNGVPTEVDTTITVNFGFNRY